jgi:hypothetical protein
VESARQSTEKLSSFKRSFKRDGASHRAAKKQQALEFLQARAGATQAQAGSVLARDASTANGRPAPSAFHAKQALSTTPAASRLSGSDRPPSGERRPSGGTTRDGGKPPPKRLLTTAELAGLKFEVLRKGADEEARRSSFASLPARLGRALAGKGSRIEDIVRQWDENGDGEVNLMEVRCKGPGARSPHAIRPAPTRAACHRRRLPPWPPPHRRRATPALDSPVPRAVPPEHARPQARTRQCRDVGDRRPL